MSQQKQQQPQQQPLIPFFAQQQPLQPPTLTEEYVASLLVEMENALQNDIERAEVRDYKMAKEIVPTIVSLETPHICFLRIEEYQSIKAARRLAMYWKCRREYFGEERWLLRMTQTGSGTLNAQDIAALRTGFALCLNTPQGETVGILNYARLSQLFPPSDDIPTTTISPPPPPPPPVSSSASQAASKPTMSTRNSPPTTTKSGNTMSSANVKRIALYLATVCSNEASQTIGISYLFLVSAAERRFEISPHADLWDMVFQAFPTKVKRVAVAQVYDPHKLELLDFVRFRTTKVLEFNTGRAPEVYHGNSMAETIESLEQGGFPRSVVPMELGGDWDYDVGTLSFARMRITFEEIMSAAPAILSTVGLTLSSSAGAGSPLNAMMVPSTAAAAAAAAAVVVPFSDMSSQQWVTQMTAKPRKRKGEPEMSTEARRQRDALYSRRMYHRRKLEITSLQGQVALLNQGLEAAKREQARLQSLLVQAYRTIHEHQLPASPYAFTTSANMDGGGGLDSPPPPPGTLP